MKAGVDYIGVTVFFLCHDEQNRFLFHKRSQKCRDEQGRWDSGGGKLEFGETLEQGVLRELKEEHGCDGVIEHQLPASARIREHNGIKTHWVSIGFIIKVDPEAVSIQDTEAIDEMGWFKLDALPQPLHSCVALDIKENQALLAQILGG